MTRSEHVMRIALKHLKEGPMPRSRVTNVIKNYEEGARSQAISELVECGYVSFSCGSSRRGRAPVIVSITDRGRAKLVTLEGSFKDGSVWSV